MLRAIDGGEYLARYRDHYKKLYVADADLYHWPLKQSALFRSPSWRIAALAGDPWRVMNADSEGAVDWNEHSVLDPSKSVEPAYRRYMFDRFWQPWMNLLRERSIEQLVFSVYERVGCELPCCAECGVDREEIAAAFSKIEFDIARACALFSMSDDWAMYCWEGFAILGGTPEFMEQYGELAGGWDRIRTDFKKHLEGDYDSYDYPQYRAAVERALSGPDGAWSQVARNR